MRLYKNISFYILAAMFLIGCSTFEDDGRMAEGVIEYDVSYPKIEEGSILADLLPNKMTMSFKDNVFMTDLTAGFGMFKMNVISFGEDREIAQMVKLINKKYVVKYDEEKIGVTNSREPGVKIELTENMKEIAGFKCKEAIVTIDNEAGEKYTVYYTDEIHIDQPNWFTQLPEIEGVMLEYQVERYDLCSRFTATKVIAQEIDESIFEIPEDYEEIDEKKMDDQMEEIFNSLSE